MLLEIGLPHSFFLFFIFSLILIYNSPFIWGSYVGLALVEGMDRGHQVVARTAGLPLGGSSWSSFAAGSVAVRATVTGGQTGYVRRAGHDEKTIDEENNDERPSCLPIRPPQVSNHNKAKAPVDLQSPLIGHGLEASYYFANCNTIATKLQRQSLNSGVWNLVPVNSEYSHETYCWVEFGFLITLSTGEGSGGLQLASFLFH